MTTKLYYDKFWDGHSFNNRKTIDITFEHIKANRRIYTELSGEDAIAFLKGTPQIRTSNKIPLLEREGLNSKLLKVYVYHRQAYEYSRPSSVIITIIDVNTDYLEKLVIGGGQIPSSSLLKKAICNHKKYQETTQGQGKSSNMQRIANSASDVKIMREIMKPVTYDMIDDVQEIDFSFVKVDLFKYQKQTIRWAIKTERKQRSYEYYPKSSANIGGRVIFMNDKFSINEPKRVTFRGGGLIDEVGLGKTVQMLSIMELNKDPPRGIVMSPSKLHSRATLVICPNQLCMQWKNEILKMINRKINIITIVNKVQYAKTTYKELIEADVVIIPFTLFDNRCMIDQWNYEVSNEKNFYKTYWTPEINDFVEGVFDKMGKELLDEGKNGLLRTNPIFQLIHWHRIVVDEFHELFFMYSRAHGAKNLIKHFKSSYRWIISATPFENRGTLHEIIKFLSSFGSDEYKERDMSELLTDDSIAFHVIEKLCRRNTKASVKREIEIPNPEEEIIWLKMSSTERLMYNAYLANPNNSKFSNEARQLCCHPQISESSRDALSNCQSLDDIEKAILTHYKEQVEYSKGMIDKYTNKKDKLEEKISDGLTKIQSETNEDARNKLEEKIRKRMDTMEKYTNKLEEHTKEHSGRKSTFEFFNGVIDKIKNIIEDPKGKQEAANTNGDNNCIVCLDQIQKDNLGLTKCGHLYCYNCIMTCVGNYMNCPLCKTTLNSNDVYMLSLGMHSESDPNNLDNTNKLDTLVGKVGTKLAHLITYLKKHGDHCVIFSEWDSFLVKIGQILNENGIKNKFCTGNTYQRDGAIKAFNKGDVKVIMLSSNSNASGTNLTLAKRIIFLDPIYGSYTHRKLQEKQCIGRAHRLGQEHTLKIVRFLIEDTVEEEIHMMNLTEDQRKSS